MECADSKEKTTSAATYVICLTAKIWLTSSEWWHHFSSLVCFKTFNLVKLITLQILITFIGFNGFRMGCKFITNRYVLLR
ncbi:MAG: hypothetical protein ACTS5A_01025 [Candidatus Hodgkinia cicadicola]